MADLPKRVWSGKSQVYSWKKWLWEKDWKVWVFDPNFEEVTSWQTYSVNRWEDLPDSAELEVYGKDSFSATDIGTFEDWLEATYSFLDYNESVLKTGKVKDGETPVAPADPTREATAQYTYTFSGWNPTVWPINKNTTFVAQYNATTNTYNIQFTVNSQDYGHYSWSRYSGEFTAVLLEDVPYWTAITVANDAITIWDDVVTAVANSWYEFSSWGEVPETVTWTTSIVASFEAATPSMTPREEWVLIQNYIENNFDASDVEDLLSEFRSWQETDQFPEDKPEDNLEAFVISGVTYTPTISSILPDWASCTFICDWLYKHVWNLYLGTDSETWNTIIQGVEVTEWFLTIDSNDLWPDDLNISYFTFDDWQWGTNALPIVPPMSYPMPLDYSTGETYQVRAIQDPDNDSCPEKISFEYYDTTDEQWIPVLCWSEPTFIFSYGDTQTFIWWEYTTDGWTTWTSINGTATFQANAQIVFRSIAWA